MKVKLMDNFRYADRIGDDDPSSYINFIRDWPYEVIHTFEHSKYGVVDHTVYVIMNEEGDTLSVSKEVCMND